MSIVKMKKMAIIGLDTQKDKLISELMEAGAVQITDATQRLSEDEELVKIVTPDESSDEEEAAFSAQINNAAIALETLEKYSREKAPLFATRKAMKEEEFEKILEDEDKITDDINYVLALSARLHATREKLNRTTTQLKAITPWLAYDIPLETVETERIDINIGTIPSTVDMKSVKTQIGEENSAFLIDEVNRDKELIYVISMTLKNETEQIITSLKQYGYTPSPFSGLSGTVSDNMERIQVEIEKLTEECDDIVNEIAGLGYLRNGIECLYDKLSIERDRQKVKKKMLRTKHTFALEGWVPVKCMGEVNRILEANNCYPLYRNPKEGEAVPVATQNSGIAYPFEAITEMYSLPDYHGFDPTKILSFFYAMFFGIMLSDAGYGIIIAVSCYIVLRKFDLEGMTYKMIKVFMYCGISTVFWGAMFGGWFGDFLPVAARTLFNKEVTVPALWFNPVEDPTKLLIWSLVFGVVHIFIGMGIKAYMLIKAGHFKDAVFDIFSWYLVILGAAMWIGGGAISEGLVKPGMVMAIIGCLILLFTGGRNNKGFGKVIGGLSSLYDITSYLSDILSYARLLALGLATGVIAQVVNLMGSLAGGGLKGGIIMMIVFLFGHTFNLAINALGAFVHSSRLQYIEFFGKFYEDGGDEFDPFRKNTKYVRLTNDKNGGTK